MEFMSHHQLGQAGEIRKPMGIHYSDWKGTGEGSKSGSKSQETCRPFGLPTTVSRHLFELGCAAFFDVC